MDWLTDPQIWIALASGLLLWTLAYQAPYTHRLDIGGSLQTGRRYDDTPYLSDFNDPEPDPIPDQATLLFRWSRADSTIALPGIGGGRWLARLRASAGSRPEPVVSQWDDGAHSYRVAIGKAQRVFDAGRIFDQDGKLVSSEPGRRVAGAKGALDAARDVHQERVTGRVAEAIVHGLEVVEVQEEDRQTPSIPAAA